MMEAENLKPEKKDQSVSAEREPMGGEDEINLLDLLLVLLKHKKMIMGAMVAAFAIACGATLLMPNIYTATARLLPPQQEKGGLGAMMAGMGDLAALAGVSVGGGSADLYVGMLKSRTVADAVIKRFDLMKRFEWEKRADAYKALDQKVKISADKKTGFITITADDKDPKFAADLANAYVDELKRLNVQINLSSAGRERVFLEQRLKIVKGDLASAEDRLRVFQEKNKAIKIDAQATAVIESIARLKGEIASKEVELGVLLTTQTEQNPQVKALREAVGQLRGQLRKLEDSSAGKRVGSDVFIATSDVPDVGLQYARLLRDLKVQETLFELLTKQYEVAKISEAKNTSALQVLDDAAVPDGKSGPRRSLIVLMATVAAGFMAAFVAFARDAGQRMNTADLQRWNEIRSGMRLRRGNG